MIKESGLNGDVLAMLKMTFKKYADIEQVKLYGSRAKGTYNERSDIDLAVYGKRLDRFVISQLLLDLDDSEIPYLVDLQNYHDIKNQQLIDHINRVGLIIYNRDYNFDDSTNDV